MDDLDRARRGGIQAVATVALVKGAASAAALASGFRAVSDDDFARVVIAETWARAPRWDASGTSWLPLPFWVNGAAMIALGRGLFAAQLIAIAAGIAAAILVYVAARWLGEDRGAATAGAILAAVFPWSARLGAATVPELPTAALTLLAAAALGSEAGPSRERRLLLGAAAASAAALSRYEAWPVALVLAAACAIEAARRARIAPAIAASIALAGPGAWLAWNHHAHGHALHFLARVAAYKQALGGDTPGAGARLSAYPAAMVREEPEIAAVLCVAVIVIAIAAGRSSARAALSRYAWPAGVVVAQIAALSAAMIKDGAPTHHPERAVLAALLLLAMCGGALAVRAARSRRAWIAPIAFAAGLAAIVVRPRVSREAFAARGDEVAIGLAAAAIARPGEPVLVEVADYGYLAVTAAFGRPEDTVPDRSVDPRHDKQPSSFADATAITRRAAASRARWAVARDAAPARSALGEPAAVRGAWAVFRVKEAAP